MLGNQFACKGQANELFTTGRVEGQAKELYKHVVVGEGQATEL